MEELPLPHDERREVWRDIPGFEGYEVSCLGRIRSWRPPYRFAKPRRSPLLRVLTVRTAGYPEIVLRDDSGKRQVLRLHRLVLSTFCSAPDGRLACHINGVPDINSINNLYWGTYIQNAADHVRHRKEATPKPRMRIAFREPAARPGGELPLPWPEDREVWRPVPGHSLYEVSSRGRIRSWRPTNSRSVAAPRLSPVIRKPTRHGRTGLHQSIRLQNGRGRGVAKTRLVHRVVLEAFVGPAPKGLVCRHLDGNPLNNSINNLCWGTSSDNSKDAVRHGTVTLPRIRGEANRRAKLTENDVREIRRLVAEGADTGAIALQMRVASTTVRRVASGRTWGHVA